ncbi:outer membrane protein [Hoeflea sp. TYP-13]|uniref:outer membrane protein n=1 Tax=Hoeflea sp. TYP-13 TaxID=3230023 RepID=UPI0034C6954B
MRNKIFAGVMVGVLHATTAYSADAIVEPPQQPLAAPVELYDWTGFYAGAYAGGGWGDVDFSFPTVPSASTTDVDGALVGGQIGYNYQTGNWVIGAEADMAWSGIDGSSLCPNPAFNCNADIDWLATVRGRVGFASNNFLIYATGGLSVADVDYVATSVATGVPFGPTISDTATGYNVGGGAEWGFYQNWSAKIEYLYHDFGDTNLTAASFGSAGTADLDMHTVKFGLNYRFNFLNP